MIDKKLIHFNTKEEFDQQKDNIKENSIVFIKDSTEIYTHGTEYQWVGWTYLASPYPTGYTVYRIVDGEVFDTSDSPFYIKK